MTHIITGLFRNMDQAQKAVEELKDAGYENDISILSRQSEDVVEAAPKDDATSQAAATGGVLGGLAGLIAGASTIVAPGLGTVVIAGPLMALWGITGAAAGALTGGIVGALMDAGVSEEEARIYEEALGRGEVLVAVSSEHGDEEEIRAIYRNNGATTTQTEHQVTQSA